MFVCNIENCSRQFARKHDLTKHQNQKHLNIDNTVDKCFLCGQLFNSDDELQRHYVNAHKSSRRFKIKESAFKRKFMTLRYHFLDNEKDFLMSQRGIKNLIAKEIEIEAAKRVMTKISLIFIAEMIMTDHQGEKVTKALIPFRAPGFYANAQARKKIEEGVKKSFGHQKQSLDEFMRSGSNWQFSRSVAYDIEITGVNPIRGGCGKISLVTFDNSTNLYSPKNKDQSCFLYCIAYFLLYGMLINKKVPFKNENLKLKTMIKKEFDLTGIKFPMSIEDIKKFAKNNRQLDLRYNVMMRTKDDKIFPLEYGIGTGKNFVNILLYHTNDGGHYMLIKNIDNFLKKVYNNGKKRSYQRAFFCVNCFNSFSKKDLRDEHSKTCCLNKARIEKVPSEGENIIRFKNFERTHRLDYIAYVDFECVLNPNATKICQECSSLKCKCDTSYIEDINQQLPICYSFLVLGPNNKIVHEDTYVGEDAHIHFIGHLLEQEKLWVSDLLETKKTIIMTTEDENDFLSANHCYICKNLFTSGTVKCKDHCHFTSKYLGAACQSCNLRRRRPKTLKIFAHNSSRYDMHFIIKALANYTGDIHNISVLPYNGENFRTMRFNCFEFMDSLAFLQESLSQLANNLKESNHKYEILKQTYLTQKHGRLCKERMEMVLGKSFFPYEYCKSLETMQKTKKLPKRTDFYSTLSETSISKEDHCFAKKVWKEFEMKNLIDYTALYCKIDVVILAEVFEKFRDEMIKFSQIDPGHYISLPAYGYDSMLKITQAEIELPTDIDIVQFLEMGKRGGVSFINTRYLSSETLDGEIIYQDRNNLYGEAQMQKLPYKDFRWLDKNEIASFDVSRLDLEGEKGYFVECDLHYPKKLHESHSSLPLAPEILEVNFDNLSPFIQSSIEKTDGKHYKDVKLMSTFHDKQNYVLHAKNLKLYLTLGLRLKAIHRVLEFTQTHLLAPYIEKTTEARQQANSKFEMDLFKKLVSKKYCSCVIRITDNILTIVLQQIEADNNTTILFHNSCKH